MGLEETPFPVGDPDEREMLLQWLGFLRGAVLRKVAGLDEAQARQRPGGRLLPLVGIVHHLAAVEWRWIDGGFGGVAVHRADDELTPGPEVTLDRAVAAYRQRAEATDRTVRSLPLDHRSDPASWAEGLDLRFVLVHLINETARHAGHADAAREMIDGLTGE